MRKNLTTQDVVDKFITSEMLEQLHRATKNGIWEGADGAKAILCNDRMVALKHRGDKYHKEALFRCVSAICQSSVQSNDPSVIQKTSQEFGELSNVRKIKSKIKEALKALSVK